MRHLPKPKEDPGAIFLDCVSAINDLDLKNRLTKCKNIIASEAANYEVNIKSNSLHSLTTNKSTKVNKAVRLFSGQVTIEEMKDVYTYYFVPQMSPGRDLYNRILALPENRKCPYCFHRLVTTIDHYLPKAYYPLLSVVPANLVPSCKDCNTGSKRSGRPQKATDEILHPYFDNVEDDLWLKARVKKTFPVTVEFFVQGPATWTPLLQERVRNHFSTLDLETLYGAQAADELGNINYQLNQQFNMGGEEAVRVHLTGEAISRRKKYTNSWQTAFYTAIANDGWFCNEGFNFF